MIDKTIEYQVSSDNVFADLSLPNPNERKAKAEIGLKIISIAENKGLTQKKAASLLPIDQPKISTLYNNNRRPSGFSIT